MKPTSTGNKRFFFGFLIITAYDFKHSGFWSLVHCTLNDVKGTLACFFTFIKTLQHGLCHNFTQAQISSSLCSAVAIFKSNRVQFYSSIIGSHVSATRESLLAKFHFYSSIPVKCHGFVTGSLGDNTVVCLAVCGWHGSRILRTSHHRLGRGTVRVPAPRAPLFPVWWQGAWGLAVQLLLPAVLMADTSGWLSRDPRCEGPAYVIELR